MGKVLAPLDPVADLKRLLPRGGRPREVRTSVLAWWAAHDLGAHPAAVGKRVALALIEQVPPEAKLAGIIVLHELLGAQLRSADLPAFARLFADGHLAEPRCVDWFCMKVLVTLVDRQTGRREVTRGLAQWRTAETCWQRRAACLAFIKVAPQGDAAVPGLTDLVLATCATVVWSPERCDQTAVGWLLRELSRAEPRRVEQFFRRHALLMSHEAARQATARLPEALRAELLTHHKRATSLRAGKP
ncbi:MAG: DNA alkylation repair protein [Kofleriaceae bacterium]